MNIQTKTICNSCIIVGLLLLSVEMILLILESTLLNEKKVFIDMHVAL